MKRIFRCLVISVLLLPAFSAFVNAQAPIPPEKKKLIEEIVRLLKMDTQMPELTNIMLKDLEKTFPSLFAAAIDDRNDLTDEQKLELKAEAGEKISSLSRRIVQRINESVDFKKYIEEAIYPIYDKIYSDQELKDIAAFYRTVTGQKVIATMPQLFSEAQNASREKLLPQLVPIIRQLVSEEFNAQSPPPPKRLKS